MQNLVDVSHAVCAHAGGHNNFGTFEPTSPNLGSWLTP